MNKIHTQPIIGNVSLTSVIHDKTHAQLIVGMFH
jgi:hypothetical protein